MAEAPKLLPFAELMREAHERAGGLTDFGEGPFVEPLKRFLESLEGEAHLNAIGVMIARERILGHTVNRLHYINDRKQYPEISKQKIVRPVFSFLPPRLLRAAGEWPVRILHVRH